MKQNPLNMMPNIDTKKKKKKRFIMNSQDLTTMRGIGKLIRYIRKQQVVTQEELVGIPSLDTRFVYPSHLRAFFRE